MSGEGFLGRWSRRKRGLGRAEPDPPPPPAAARPEAAPPEAGPAAAPPAAPPAVPAFDPASLPPLESLGPQSDFTAFLKPDVPALLRQAALRRMWSLDPGIRDFVGPADYAWDFNAPDGVPGFALELGGDVRRLLAQAIGSPPEPEEEAREAALAEAPPAETPAIETPAAEVPVAETPLGEGAPEAPAGISADPAPDTLADAAPALRPVPLRLSPAVPLEPQQPTPEAPPGAPEAGPALAPRRRHGGAVPQ